MKGYRGHPSETYIVCTRYLFIPMIEGKLDFEREVQEFDHAACHYGGTVRTTRNFIEFMNYLKFQTKTHIHNITCKENFNIKHG